MRGSRRLLLQLKNDAVLIAIVLVIYISILKILLRKPNSTHFPMPVMYGPAVSVKKLFLATHGRSIHDGNVYYFVA